MLTHHEAFERLTQAIQQNGAEVTPQQILDEVSPEAQRLLLHRLDDAAADSAEEAQESGTAASIRPVLKTDELYVPVAWQLAREAEIEVFHSGKLITGQVAVRAYLALDPTELPLFHNDARWLFYTGLTFGLPEDTLCDTYRDEALYLLSDSNLNLLDALSLHEGLGLTESFRTSDLLGHNHVRQLPEGGRFDDVVEFMAETQQITAAFKAIPDLLSALDLLTPPDSIQLTSSHFPRLISWLLADRTT